MDRIPMTRAGYEKLKAELRHLETVELPKVLDRLAKAREEGDLSENAEYQFSQEARLLLEARIRDYRDRLSRAYLVDPAAMPRDQVALGATVRVKDLDTGEEEEFTLVGAGEDDPSANKILVTCPLAQGLVGKRVGETAQIQVPAGLLRFEILHIRYDSPEPPSEK